MYTLEILVQELTVPNPISSPDDVSIPHHLIMIGMFLCHVNRRPVFDGQKAPRFTGFVTGFLSSIENAIVLPNNICRSGFHACFGYCVLENSFRNLSEILHSVMELCGSSDLSCPSQSPPSAPVITPADYLDDGQIDEWISKLQQEGEGSRISLSGPSVTHSSIPTSPQLITPVSDTTTTAKANQTGQNISRQ
jgi:hypothetical protein